MEKLPYTISELVSSSPCRSSDGMIYTSKKVDEWLVVDITSGEKVDMINADSPMCPTRPETDHLPDSSNVKNYPLHNLLYLFKSEYQISVFNAQTREKLSNMTFVDYSPSIISSISQNSYNFIHLTSSVSGKVATIDVSNGVNSFMWSNQFSSPIVAMYQLKENSNFPILHRIPFLTIGGLVNIKNFSHHNSLYPSVYIGQLTESKSLYALSALVDYKQIRKDSNYLIEGPSTDLAKDIEIFGYYEYPKVSDTKFEAIQKSELISSIVQQASKAVIEQLDIPSLGQNILPDYLDNYNSLVNNLIYLVCSLIALVIVIPLTITYYYWWSSSSSKSSANPETTTTTAVNPIQSHTDSKNIKIGKISYNTTDIIGRGCAGTCVYKGLFEDRQHVAVKRIVSDCYKLANREIELLRKLQHTHLIRYFATEYDNQFLYIAIELAELTLAEYIENRDKLKFHFDKKEILHQACLGLAHLHSLNIVHRDIKPQNILISLPMNPDMNRKIMISDFGVSKILCSDSLTTDLSAGTEGWIAPEVLKSRMSGLNVKASKYNDIFSMGCLIFYVYTDSGHPFGNQLNRQTNILNGSVDLSAIDSEEDMCLFTLVEPMIAADFQKRPSIEVVNKHPYFWNAKQQLQFLQDVSDRFECEPSESEIIRLLEYNNLDVCCGDWRRWISVELQEDLRKFRSYKGSSVRDLLRAIRNKRNHYHELDPKLQNALGKIPNEFVHYFTSKFPRLIIHSYIALQCCQSEDPFQNYYHSSTNGEKNFTYRMLPRSSILWYEKLQGTNPFFPFESRNKKNDKKGLKLRNNNNENCSPSKTTECD